MRAAVAVYVYTHLKWDFAVEVYDAADLVAGDGRRGRLRKDYASAVALARFANVRS